MTKTHYIIAAVVLGFAILATALDFMSTKTPGGNTPAESPEGVIRAYYAALGEKDAKTAQALLSPELQVLLPEATLAQGAAALEEIKVTGIEKNAEAEDVIVYKTDFDVTPAPGVQTSWKQGINLRYIALVNLRNNWRISKIATDPVNADDPRNTQQVLPSQINRLGNGGSYEFQKGAEFTVILDNEFYPKENLEANCNPEGAIAQGEDVSSVTSPFYGVKYKANASGSCELQTGSFKTSITVR